MTTFIMPSNRNKYDAISAFNDLLTVHWLKTIIKVSRLVILFMSMNRNRHKDWY